MRKVLTVAALALALFPAAWFTYLLVEDKGNLTLRIALVIAFVLLALGGPILLALIASGVEQGEGEIKIRDWVTGRAKVHVRRRGKPPPDQTD